MRWDIVFIILLLLMGTGATYKYEEYQCDKYSEAGFTTEVKFMGRCKILYENEYVTYYTMEEKIEKSKLKDYVDAFVSKEDALSGDREK